MERRAHVAIIRHAALVRKLVTAPSSFECTTKRATVRGPRGGARCSRLARSTGGKVSLTRNVLDPQEAGGRTSQRVEQSRVCRHHWAALLVAERDIETVVERSIP